MCLFSFFFFSSRRRHTRWTGDWSSDVCSSDLWVEHAGARLAQRDPLAPAPLPQLPREAVQVGAGPRVSERDVLERHAGVVGLAAHHVGVAQQDRRGDPFVGEDARRLEDAGLLALGEDDPLRLLLLYPGGEP